MILFGNLSTLFGRFFSDFWEVGGTTWKLDCVIQMTGNCLDKKELLLPPSIVLTISSFSEFLISGLASFALPFPWLFSNSSRMVLLPLSIKRYQSPNPVATGKTVLNITLAYAMFLWIDTSILTLCNLTQFLRVFQFRVLLLSNVCLRKNEEAIFDHS